MNGESRYEWVWIMVSQTGDSEKRSEGGLREAEIARFHPFNRDRTDSPIEAERGQREHKCMNGEKAGLMESWPGRTCALVFEGSEASTSCASRTISSVNFRRSCASPADAHIHTYLELDGGGSEACQLIMKTLSPMMQGYGAKATSTQSRFHAQALPRAVASVTALLAHACVSNACISIACLI